MNSQSHSRKRVPTEAEFIAVEKSDDFQHLRKTFRGFAFPVTIAFLAWYLFYIVVATYAYDFVTTPVIGVINIGMILGLAQFATAGLITWAYVRFADNKLDPETAKIRQQMEQEA
ncbi:DUF485 domain-containing protein [Corynebacterium pelargi]|uniref:Uncharacterized protein n=1 Tax=Corynebacterium pelargi TaxID=1471400 RepID=A0A410W747_9CORY|nr:DUF485 domain-containing protein [Corynebacterium pelargi]QAU51647.1 hypothetical protein CPELA_01740 [Corynebacterium pelargi]GGG80258.1 membrane protein [Corynebacterium pelargi]